MTVPNPPGLANLQATTGQISYNQATGKKTSNISFSNALANTASGALSTAASVTGASGLQTITSGLHQMSALTSAAGSNAGGAPLAFSGGGGGGAALTNVSNTFTSGVGASNASTFANTPPGGGGMGGIPGGTGAGFGNGGNPSESYGGMIDPAMQGQLDAMAAMNGQMMSVQLAMAEFSIKTQAQSNIIKVYTDTSKAVVNNIK